MNHSTGRATVAILAHRGDTAALALANLLHRRGECQVIYADAVSISRARVVHHPSSGPIRSGTALVGSRSHDRIALRNGDAITPATSVVLCRLSTVTPTLQSTPANQAYAEAETFAYALSWLAGLGDAVVNRVTPMGLTGSMPDLIRLHRLATRVGLLVPRFTLASNGATANYPRELPEAPWPEPGLPYSSYVSDHGSATGLRTGSDADAAVSFGPPLPQPVWRQERVQPVGSVLVTGGRVVGAPLRMASRLVALVEAAGLRMAEVSLGLTQAAGEPVVTGLNPLPSLEAAGQLDAAADFIENLAAMRTAATNTPSTITDEFSTGSAA